MCMCVFQLTNNVSECVCAQCVCVFWLPNKMCVCKHACVCVSLCVCFGSLIKCVDANTRVCEFVCVLVH